MKNLSKKDFEIDVIYTGFFRFFEKNLSTEEAKEHNNLVKNNLVIQKAEKGSNIITLNKTHYI